MKTKPKVVVGLLLGGLAAGWVFELPLRWTAASAYRSFFPEQNSERPVYDDTAQGSVDLADFVGKSRLAWPGAEVSRVHEAAIDVAVGLLHHSDIEVGSYSGGAFVRWELSSWKAAEKIRRELSASGTFLSERGRYVFRRK